VARELTMPKLSDSMADAVIVRWLVSPGDDFQRGEALIEVETDKATVVYEADSGGTLDAILVPEGAAAAVGQPIATLTNGADGTAAAATQGDGSDALRANATPVAKRTAVELGVSLHGVTGTGPGGRITAEDVQKAAADAGAAAHQPAVGGKGDVRVLELTATQATIARRMVESATTIPTFTVSIDVDMSLIVSLREAADEAPSLNDFIVKAAAVALRELPRFNASYVDGTVEWYSRINVGIAVATDDALLVPVVHDADKKTLTEIAEETRRLADAARRRAIQPEDLHDATFTVSNLGMFGVRSFTALIDPPQAAILAVGGVRPGGAMTATLTCDHRVVYGADGAQFLSRLRELLERPLALTT
jgi:pyruvate dehydrogenase E2 component (dihydrolipoamide acetyltransferase)